MNQLTRAAKTLTLLATLALSTLTFTSGCVLEAGSNDESAWADELGATDGSEKEEVGEAQDEIKGGTRPNCGYCWYWSESDRKCVRSELQVCAGDGA